MLLLDTNIWLELMLEQQKAETVQALFEATPVERLSITDFSLHSIGVILTRTGRLATLGAFLDDLAGEPGVTVVRLTASELRLLPAVSQRFGLDFDDAYQYVAARARGLELVSFDADFDKTDLARRVP